MLDFVFVRSGVGGVTDTPSTSDPDLSALWSLLEEALDRSSRTSDAVELDAVAELCTRAAAIARQTAERLRA